MKQPYSQPQLLDSRSANRRGLIATALIALIIIVDQVIKYYIKTNFSLYESYEVTSWFHIVFTENRGMAFGMEFVGTMFLCIFRVIAIALFSVVLVRFVRRKYPFGLLICLAMVIAGAVGNIIDNMFNGLVYSESIPYAAPATLVPFGEGYGTFLSGRVIDMFYFPLFTWPDWVPFVGGNIFFGAIFNFADASISCGAIAIALFYYKYIYLGKPKADASAESEDTPAENK